MKSQPRKRLSPSIQRKSWKVGKKASQQKWERWIERTKVVLPGGRKI